MIFWDDFDTRSTKVLCDGCHRDISPQVFEALKHPWRSRIKSMSKSALNIFNGQWELKFGKTRWVITRFNVRGQTPSFLFKHMKEHTEWYQEKVQDHNV